MVMEEEEVVATEVEVAEDIEGTVVRQEIYQNHVIPM
jgi:hypothetical protein